MTPLDREIATFLLAGDHPTLATLREQWATATVTKRSIWLFAYDAWLTLAPGLSGVFRKGFARIDDVRAEVVGLSGPAELRLGIRDGFIESVGGIAPNDEPWPEDARIIRCYYVCDVEGKSELAMRDIAWALREVFERQAEPVLSWILRVGLAFFGAILGLIAATSFLHKCDLGLQWLEGNIVWILPVSFAIIPLLVKRFWLSIPIVVVLFVLFADVLAPWYRTVIHAGGKVG